MKIKITFWFWVFLASFVIALAVFITEEKMMAGIIAELIAEGKKVDLPPDATWFPKWVLSFFPALAITGLVFWFRSRFKSSTLLGLTSMALLVSGFCFFLGMTRILASSIVEFFDSVPFKQSLWGIILGIGEEAQTIFFVLSVKLGRIKPPENGFDFIRPFTLPLAVLFFFSVRVSWDFGKFLKKSTTRSKS